MRMHGPQPNKLHDELDALLDGRPVELTDELAPLVEAADALRVELAGLQLGPEVADRHLERVLGGSATVVPMPRRPQPNGWDVRRRVVAVALAAALVLAPATMASAAALPGQAMYPFKLAIEQLRLASVQWSPAREAGERTRIAHERQSAVQHLYDLEMYNQLPTAIRALNRAVVAATVAVQQARREGEPVPGVEERLGRVVATGALVLNQVLDTAAKGSTVGLTVDTAKEIQAAVQQSPAVSPSSTTTPTTAPKGGGTGTPTQTTPTAPAGQGPGSTTPATQPSTPQTTNQPETSTSQAPTTTAAPQTTAEPQTTATPPSSTEPEVTATAGSNGADVGGSGDQARSSEQAPQGYTPPTTTPPADTP
ncbi:MAG: hypothetical protein ACJ75K_25325 [Actinomycetes bacterium]